jgi:Swi5-dependent recombination DNA repair protein 1
MDQTPLPAAKRRRVEAANATLRKPFRSPLISRPQSSGPAEEVTATPTSTRSSQLVTPARTSKLAQSPFRTPVSSTSKDIVKPGKKQVATGLAIGDGGGDDVVAQMRKLQKEMDGHVVEMQRELDLVQQAKHIEAESQGRRPGEPIDAELRALAGKWKAASRQAAEELLELTRDRVASMGGLKAWRRRAAEVSQGFGDEDERSRGLDEDGEGGEDSLKGSLGKREESDDETVCASVSGRIGWH